MSTPVTDDLLTVPTRMAFGAVTANAVVVGATGVSAPVAWLLLPGMMATLSRPRSAVLVSLWAGLLVAASVAVPIITGHDADPWALATSLIVLLFLPGVAWMRTRGHARRLAHARRATPSVIPLTVGDGARHAALARAGVPAEVAAAVQLSDGAVRVLLGVVAGQVGAPATLRDRLEQLFGNLASHTSADPARMARVLADLVRRSAPSGYVAAALIEIDRQGIAQVLSCGSPPPLLVNAGGGPGADGLQVAGGGSGGPPLGLDGDAGRAEKLPDDCRIAVVTNAYALAHYDDYTSAAADSLRAATLEVASVRLLQGVARPSRVIPGLDAAPVVGPALVIGPREHPR